MSKLYGFGVGLRNKFYDWGFIKSNTFNIPIITVGNLAVGGTGKTPHTEYLVRLLQEDYKIGILSRGYKRRTKGFVEATPHSTPRDIGDEPYQMYHKFGRKVVVCVCEDRSHGIRNMQKIHPELNLIILDDGFQHRKVAADLSILLTEYNRPYFEDKMLPYGRLRESVQGVSRADMVIVTKCPSSDTAINYRILTKRLDLIPEQVLVFSRYKYERMRPVFPAAVKKERIPGIEDLPGDFTILAVCGIGNPRPFLRYVKSFAPRVKVNVFADHHEFSRKDMDVIQTRFDSIPAGKGIILTTEKDAVRLINNPYFPHQLKPYIFFIPIRVVMDDENSNRIKKAIKRHITNKK